MVSSERCGWVRNKQVALELHLQIIETNVTLQLHVVWLQSYGCRTSRAQTPPGGKWEQHNTTAPTHVYKRRLIHSAPTGEGVRERYRPGVRCGVISRVLRRGVYVGGRIRARRFKSMSGLGLVAPLPGARRYCCNFLWQRGTHAHVE